MAIILAQEKDLPDFFRLYTACMRAMRAAGIKQWGEDYPNEEVHRKDVRNGWLYIFEENGLPGSALEESGAIVAAICLNEEQAPEYKNVRWESTQPILVVHRLCVDPARQRSGIANQMMDFTEERARQCSYAAIRLDTYSGNPAALRLYDQRGYRRTGEVRFRGRSLPFICFEKIFRAQP